MDIIKSLNNTFFANVPEYSGIFSPHLHDSYTVGFTNSGLFQAFSNKKRYEAYKHSIRVTNPYDVHGGKMQMCQLTNFYPTVELMSEINYQINGTRKAPVIEEHILKDSHLYLKLQTFFQAVFLKADEMEIESSLINALSHLIQNHSTTSKSISTQEGNIKRSIEYIHDSLHVKISLEELANVVEMSKYHYLRSFKRQLGITPHQYIIQQRVQKAKDLIIDGYSLMEASLEVGFSDQSHFTRNFKKIHLYTPSYLQNSSNFILYK